MALTRRFMLDLVGKTGVSDGFVDDFKKKEKE